MLVVFLDESHIRGTGYLGRCGVAVEDGQLLPMETAFREILSRAGVPLNDPGLDVEVKWSPRHGNWIRENLDANQRRQLYRDLLTLLAAHDTRLIGAIFHYANIAAWSADVNRARRESYIHVFERIEFHAQRQSQPALVVADHEDDPISTRQRVTETFELVRSGSEYLQLGSIYKHVWPAESERHAGIQLADLVAGITTCMVANQQNYASQYWDLLRGRFAYYREPDVPQRFGLSILPSNEREVFIGNHHPYGW